MRWTAPLLASLLLTGCEKDPVWFGYWEITEVRRDGVKQEDMGVMEIIRDSGMAYFLRYRRNGSEWIPDKTPNAELGDSNAREQDDIFESYREKGETYTVYLSPFCLDYEGSLDVVDYKANRAVLKGKAQPWPGRPPEELLPLEIHLQR